jgi:ribosomal protein S27AE
MEPQFDPHSLVAAKAREIHSGACPPCGGPGPIDVHFAPRVWSAILVTVCRTKTLVTCQRCARDEQRAAIGFSLALGWWGVPFGIFLTPVQVGRNLHGIVRPPSPERPSQRLHEFAAQLVAQGARAQASRPCPHCGAPYLLSDDRDDAPRILCGSCNGEVPR